MRLIKIEKPDAIWYFTTQLKAAQFIGCSQMHINNILHGVGKTAKGWTVEYIEDDYIMSKFIDPEPNIYTSMKNGKTVKGTTFEWVDSDDILPQYINPTNTRNETIELLEKAINMLEENAKEISLLKELASKLNDKLNDTKNITSFNERSEIEL